VEQEGREAGMMKPEAVPLLLLLLASCCSCCCALHPPVYSSMHWFHLDLHHWQPQAVCLHP
jgi:hypothetical protein